MDNNELFITLIVGFSVIIFLLILPHLTSMFSGVIAKKRKSLSGIGSSSKLRLIKELNDAIIELSKTKTGAIITIVNKVDLDDLRTDGIIIDAMISSGLILSIFNKNSPLHDGAIVIKGNKIVYASTYYKITTKSVDNHLGARHRAALGISEVSDSLSIIVSEQTGAISFAKDGVLSKIRLDDFQEKFVEYLK